MGVSHVKLKARTKHHGSIDTYNLDVGLNRENEKHIAA